MRCTLRGESYETGATSSSLMTVLQPILCIKHRVSWTRTKFLFLLLSRQTLFDIWLSSNLKILLRGFWSENQGNIMHNTMTPVAAIVEQEFSSGNVSTSWRTEGPEGMLSHKGLTLKDNRVKTKYDLPISVLLPKTGYFWTDMYIHTYTSIPHLSISIWERGPILTIQQAFTPKYLHAFTKPMHSHAH